MVFPSPPPTALKRKQIFTPFLTNWGEINHYVKKLVGRQTPRGTCPDTKASCNAKPG